MSNIKSNFESIIPTALHTVYPLIYTDIPYVKEIFDELCKKGFPEELKNDKLVIYYTNNKLVKNKQKYSKKY